MKLFRRIWLKSIVGMLLLCIMMLKICPGVTSHFSSKNDSYSIEKNNEEGKDNKEESFWKNDKNKVACHLYYTEFDHYNWISLLPIYTGINKLFIEAHPIRSVPTPPPDTLV